VNSIHASYQVLDVDQSKIFTDRIISLLNEMGCIQSVDIAFNFIQTTELMKHHFFDIILADMELPEKKRFRTVATYKGNITENQNYHHPE
jgi:CheY-like chemotaxis protein